MLLNGVTRSSGALDAGPAAVARANRELRTGRDPVPLTDPWVAVSRPATPASRRPPRLPAQKPAGAAFKCSNDYLGALVSGGATGVRRTGAPGRHQVGRALLLRGRQIWFLR